MINYDFTNKNVIVTGGSMGLGKAIALEFAKAHANVLIADLDMEEALKTKEELLKYGTNILVYKLDVSNYDEVNNMINFAKDNFGSIDCLINNAGICESLPIIDQNPEMIDKIMKINVNGTLYGCKCVLPVMLEQGYGKIVNMSSIAAKLGGAGISTYAASKAAVLELTACLAREYAKNNININCICPGIIRTPLWEKMLKEITEKDPEHKEETWNAYISSIPMQRPQEPVDIAKAVLFLCTKEADNITAQNLGVDGGHTY